MIDTEPPVMTEEEGAALREALGDDYHGVGWSYLRDGLRALERRDKDATRKVGLAFLEGAMSPLELFAMFMMVEPIMMVARLAMAGRWPTGAEGAREYAMAIFADCLRFSPPPPAH